MTSFGAVEARSIRRLPDHFNAQMCRGLPWQQSAKDIYIYILNYIDGVNVCSPPAPRKRMQMQQGQQENSRPRKKPELLVNTWPFVMYEPRIRQEWCQMDPDRHRTQKGGTPGATTAAAKTPANVPVHQSQFRLKHYPCVHQRPS